MIGTAIVFGFCIWGGYDVYRRTTSITAKIIMFVIIATIIGWQLFG